MATVGIKTATLTDLKRHKPVRWWHHAIIDDMLLHPSSTLKERGERLNYNPAYLSVIINTDMFKAVYEQRRAEYQQQLDSGLVNKMHEIAAAGLDLMLETMQEKRTQIPFARLTDSVDKTLQRLGYGVKGSETGLSVSVNAPQGQVAVVTPATPEQLASARDLLRGAEQARAVNSSPQRPPALAEPSERSDEPAAPLEGEVLGPEVE